MPRMPLAATATVDAIRYFTLTAFHTNPELVCVALGDAALYVQAADWDRACEELVSRYPGAGAPTVTPSPARAAAPQAAPAAPTTLATAAPVTTLASPLRVAPAVQRGVMVDLEGAVRSGNDLALAEAAGFAPKQPYFTRGTMVVDIGVENARQMRIEHDAKPTAFEACGDFSKRILGEQRCDEIVGVHGLGMEPTGHLYDDATERRYVLQQAAFEGFCNRLGFGGAAYLTKCWPVLRQHNVNAWLGEIATREDSARADHAEEQARLAPSKRRAFEPAELKFRTRNGAAGREVFGIVSPSYPTFDVNLIADAIALAAPPDARCVIDYDGTRARFEVMFRSDVLPEKYVAGEFFKAGVIIRSDDTGRGSLRGSATIFQNLCLNLICIDEARQDLFAIPHIGSVEAMAAKFRDGFKKALGRIEPFLKAWNYSLTDDVLATARTIDPEVPMSVEEALPGLFTAIVERELVPVRGRTVDAVPKLMQMWHEDTSAARLDASVATRGSIVNAFTRYAHKVNDDAFFADEIQRAAGKMLFGRKGQKPAPLPWMPVNA